jgi:hypothetical protein
MAALDFPSDPSNGTTYTGDNGITYTYQNGKWIGTGASTSTVPTKLKNNTYELNLYANAAVSFPNYRFPISDGTDGQTLTTNGSGVLSFANPSSGTLDNLSDVVITSAANGQILKYNGSNWVNSTDGYDGGLPIASDSVAGVMKLGEGFVLDGSNKVTTRKLYSTNSTNQNQHYRLELDTNGVVVLPDQSIINGSTLRGIYGTGDANYTGITIGPNAAHREESWVWVDKDGAHVGTRYSGTISAAKQWDFTNDGIFTLPAGGDIRNSSNVSVINTPGTHLVNGEYTVALDQYGTLTIPGSLVSTQLGTMHFNSDVNFEIEANNRIQLIGAPLNLATVDSATVLGKTGDLLLDTDNKIKSYDGVRWNDVVVTKGNSKDIQLAAGANFRKSTGERVAYHNEIPTDISQLADINNLLATIEPETVNIDGGGAYAMYDTPLRADGGFSSSRWGAASTIFDGGATAGTSSFTLSLNGGGA